MVRWGDESVYGCRVEKKKEEEKKVVVLGRSASVVQGVGAGLGDRSNLFFCPRRRRLEVRLGSEGVKSSRLRVLDEPYQASRSHGPGW